MVVLLGNGHRGSANTHDIVKTQSDRLRAITGVYPSSAALRPQRPRSKGGLSLSAVTPPRVAGPGWACRPLPRGAAH